MVFIAKIESYYAGQFLSEASPLVLTGETVPSGRLCESFIEKFSDSYAYGEENDDENFYNERTNVGYRYYIAKGIKPKYPFGYGLSYTDFEYKFPC